MSSESNHFALDHRRIFKLALVGRLKNILSDRQLLEHCALRLDILYFLGYEVDEELPGHSTVSRTRQLYPAAVFEHLFDHIFRQCIACGLVSGERQALDSAPALANTSLNLMCEKQLLDPGISLGSRAGRFLFTRAALPGVFVRCRTVAEPLLSRCAGKEPASERVGPGPRVPLHRWVAGAAAGTV